MSQTSDLCICPRRSMFFVSPLWPAFNQSSQTKMEGKRSSALAGVVANISWRAIGILYSASQSSATHASRSSCLSQLVGDTRTYVRGGLLLMYRGLPNSYLTRPVSFTIGIFTGLPAVALSYSPTMYRSQALFVASATIFARANAQSSGDMTILNNATVAHGILMGLAFAVLFPFGSTLLRLFNFRGIIWVHAGFQAFAYAVALAGFGLGVWIAVETDQLTASNGHPIIGIIVIGVLFFQPFGGLIAHKLFKRNKRSNLIGTSHKWIGRIFLILGVINGGLGLQLADDTVAGEIAYGVLAGVFFALWFCVVVWRDFFSKPKVIENEDKDIDTSADRGYGWNGTNK